MTVDHALAREAYDMLVAENRALRSRLADSERHTSSTMLKSTRLAQVVSMLGQNEPVAHALERVAGQIAELFVADVVVFLLGTDDQLKVEGQWGLRADEVPTNSIDISPYLPLTSAASASWISRGSEISLPPSLGPIPAHEIAWTQFKTSDLSLGYMLVIRCVDVSFTPDERTALTAISSRIALAIENSKLSERIRYLLARNVEIAELERIRASLDLHDGPVQHLTVIALSLDLLMMRLQRGDVVEAATMATDLRKSLTNEISTIRQLMTDMRPPILDEGGLGSALRDLVLQVFVEPDFPVEITNRVGAQRFAPATETTLYRIAREALTNIRKHAQATHANVELAVRNDNVVLVIEDNGSGFDISNVVIQRGHLGLIAMRELAESLGGTFIIVSDQRGGTRIEAVIPTSDDLMPNAIEVLPIPESLS